MTTGIASSHSALIYQKPGEFVAAASGFIREGLASGEETRAVAVPEKLEQLRAELGPAAAAVEFIDVRQLYQQLATATRAMADWLRHPRKRRCRLVAEHALAHRTEAEIEDYLRFEAAANVVYRPYQVSILCAYDTTALAENVLLGCLQTHPQLLSDHTMRRNHQYLDPSAFIVGGATVREPPVTADFFGCYRNVDLAAARPFVRSRAALAGLGHEKTDNLIQAVIEVLSNALAHGAPPCRVYIYTEGPALVCHVHDSGPGLVNHLISYLPPGNGTSHGRGIWVARQLCDTLHIATDETGTHVVLRVNVPGNRAQR